MSLSRPVALAALLLSLAVAADALAAGPTAAERETARALMDDGYDKDERGDHAAALKSFVAADALMHVPTTAVEVGRMQIALGELVEARVTLLPILLANAAPGEPAVFALARQKAESMYDALTPRIPALRVAVKGEVALRSATLEIDAVAVPVETIGAPFRVNPGHHKVAIRDKAGNHAERETDVAEGEIKDVDLSMIPGAAPGVGETGGAGSGEAADAKKPASAPELGLRWGGVGLAVVGVAVGTATGVSSLSAGGAAKSSCNGNQCPPPAWDDLNRARAMATISDVAFIAAGVGAVAFGLSFVVHARSAPPAARRSVRFWTAGTSIGVAGEF